MNCLTILLVFVLNLQCDYVLFSIQKTLFMKNNSWYSGKNEIKPDNRFEIKVKIFLERKTKELKDFSRVKEQSYYFNFINFEYLILRDWMFEAVTSFLESSKVKELLWRFEISFINKPVSVLLFFNSIKGVEKQKEYVKKQQEYVSYKLQEKVSDNEIRSRNDGEDIRTKHIQMRFGMFLSSFLLEFNNYVKNTKKEELDKIVNNAQFDLYSFPNYSECFENLKELIKNLRYFNLLEDYSTSRSLYTRFPTVSIDETTLKVSELKERLYEKNYEHLKKDNEIEFDETWDELYNECFTYLKDEIMNKYILFPIGEKYNIDYYIDQLSIFYIQSAKKEHKNYKSAASENKRNVVHGLFFSLRDNLINLQSKAVKDLCEFEYIPEHFSKLLEKEVTTLEDFKEVEKMVCDYHNMLVYVVESACKFENIPRYSCYYCSPIIIDNFNIKIVEGLQIKFNHPVRHGMIERGFDAEENEITMVKDIDYFIDNDDSLYCPLEVLRMKNIREIEVISISTLNGGKNSKRVDIDAYYLSNNTTLNSIQRLFFI